jgi:hypothetical protein
VSVTTFFVYLLMRYEHDVQDAINILWTATLSGSKFIQQIWLETIMQHQVHVLSVFDKISFKYWLFVPQTLDTKAGQLCTSSTMNMMYKMQLIFFGLLILPWNFNCLFTSRSDNYFIISGHILQEKFFFLIKFVKHLLLSSRKDTY